MSPGSGNSMAQRLARFRSGLASARAIIAKLAARVEQLTAPPQVQGVVLYTVMSAPSASEIGKIDEGRRVKVVSARLPDFTDKIGHVISEPDENGEVMVVFLDGTYEFFGVGLTDVRNTDRELEVANDSSRKVMALVNGRRLELDYPDGMTLAAGDFVMISQKTNQVIGLSADQQTITGDIATVSKIRADKLCEISYRDGHRAVVTGKFPSVKVGDQVVVDESVSIILNNLGNNDERFRLTGSTGVSWDDIGGLDEARQQLEEGILGPAQHPGVYAYHQVGVIKGALISGPSGCGKGMLAKALATHLARIYKQDAFPPDAYLLLNGSEVQEKYVGAAEATVRAIWKRGEDHFVQYGYPAVLVLDEAEALLSKRGSGISSDVEKTMVPTWLALMDGINHSSLIVILLTNRPDLLDPAITRDGRLDTKIQVSRPDRAATETIFALYLKKHPLPEGVTADSLAQKVTESLYDPSLAFYRIDQGAEKDSAPIFLTLANLSSGAMIKGIVDRASRLAVRRDIAAGTTSPLTQNELLEAIRVTYQQNYHLDHEEPLTELTRDLPLRPRIKKLSLVSK